ncbi:MAG: hypothetical protein NT178_08150, partial [Proteobacteria bacterium]|nr:hypothetical protein [Pseudomonadota bacterium]
SLNIVIVLFLFYAIGYYIVVSKLCSNSLNISSTIVGWAVQYHLKCNMLPMRAEGMLRKQPRSALSKRGGGFYFHTEKIESSPFFIQNDKPTPGDKSKTG